jgi:hypothetical protein
MRHDLRPPALMPHREQRAAVAAFVLDVLEPAGDVGDAAEAGHAAEEEGCEAVGVVLVGFFSGGRGVGRVGGGMDGGNVLRSASSLELRPGECSHAARGAVDGRRALLKGTERSGVCEGLLLLLLLSYALAIFLSLQPTSQPISISLLSISLFPSVFFVFLTWGDMGNRGGKAYRWCPLSVLLLVRNRSSAIRRLLVHSLASGHALVLRWCSLDGSVRILWEL